MRIGFAGTPEIAGRVLVALNGLNHEIVLVITKPDSVQGRGKKQSQSAVSEIASNLGLKLIKPATLIDADLKRFIQTMNLDLIVVVAYGNLIPKDLLDVPKYGWFNLHYSLLPKYRGAAPVQRAIMADESETGVTFFKLDEGMDTGPILNQQRCAITQQDDAISVFEELTQMGIEIIKESIQEITEGKINLVEQDAKISSLAPKLKPGEEMINWNDSQTEIFNLIRACAAGPIAYTHFLESRVKIGRASKSDTYGLEPGRVVKTDGVIRVGTGTGDLNLLLVQPAGRKLMFATDWYNGLHTDKVRFE